MALSKKILKSKAVQKTLAMLLALYIRLVYYTNLKTHLIDEGAKPYLRGEGNAIFAFWHGRMMLLPAFCPPCHKMRVLISLHRDGTLISSVIGHFGQATISGSSSKGGKAALMEILRALKHDDNISITPDGPRGPKQIAQKGIITAAKLSGKVILPVTFSSTRHKRFNSWDRFMLALPFGRIVFCVGAPILVPRECDEETEEKIRKSFEDRMNALVIKADEITHA